MEKIDYDVADDMRRRFETWTSIASHCGVSIISLKQWQQLVQYTDPFPLLEGEELNAMVEKTLPIRSVPFSDALCTGSPDPAALM